MNSLEAEYSFLAPTWKLPSVGTPSMYPGPTYSPSLPKLTPNSSTRNHTMQNPRYIPPNSNRRIPSNQQPGGRSVQLPPSQQSNTQHRAHEHHHDQHQAHELTNDQHQHNEYSNSEHHPDQHRDHNGQHRTSEQPNNNFDPNDQYQMSIQSNQSGHGDNRGFNYPPPAPSHPTQKRVQIMDNNQHTPSSERESHDSHSPEYNQKQQMSKSPPRRHQLEDGKSDSTLNSVNRPSNFKVHEYLYGLAAPDPGSYVNAYKNHRRRLDDEKVNRKSVMTEYKTFAQNGGFGPSFGRFDNMRHEEKVDTENKRKSYSKVVREVNQHKVEEHKRIQNNGGQQRIRHYAVPPPKHRRPEAMRSNFLSPQEVREFERRVKIEHDANCKCSLHSSPHYSPT